MRQLARRSALRITLLVLLLLFASGVPVWGTLTVGAAGPMTIDGLIDGGYQQLYNNGNATLYFHADGTKFYFALLNKPNENVFGPNPGAYHDTYQTGWNNHTFGHLRNSDHVKIQLSCLVGGTTQSVNFGLDYLYQTGGSWAAGLGGPDSVAPSGTTGLLSGLQASSSLVWDLINQSVHGWDYTMGGAAQDQWQSPPFSPTYPNLGTYSAWEIRDIYEFAFDRAPFAACDALSLTVTDVHNSPPKWGEPGFTGPPIPIDTPTPTPTSSATATPTNTPVPPTNTPTVTGTPVPPTSTPTATVTPTTPSEQPPNPTATNTPVPPPPSAPTATNTPVVVVLAPPPPSATPIVQVLAPPPPAPTRVVQVLAPALPKAGGVPINGTVLSLLGLALTAAGIGLRRLIR